MKEKPKSEEYAAFERLLGKVLETSHDELKKKLEAEKAAKKQPSSGPASHDKD